MANRQLFPETDTKSELRPTQQLLPTIGTASAVQRERRSWKSEVTRLNAVIAQLEAQLAQRMLDASYLAVLRESDRDSNIAKENLLNQQAERQFSSLLEIAPDAMVIADFDGTIVLVNSHAEVLFGYCRQELIGMKLDDLMPTECRASQDAYLSEFLSSAPSKTISPSAELWGLRKDASEFPFEVSLSPLNTLAGALTIGAFRDLTERRETDRLVLRAQRLESIGTFAGNIAHDLNNALAPILMSLELLRLQNPDCRDLIATIEAGANRGVEMLRQLLVFSKGSFVEFKPVHPQDTIDEVVSFVSGTFPDNIQFHAPIHADLNSVLGDATQIHQVLVNLCLNARDAMPQGGVLTLSAENEEIDSAFAGRIPGAVPGAYVVWKVSDTGTGIPHDLMDRIYEPFYSTKGHGKGTGLGLSIVVGIVKSHGGFLVAQSMPSLGSCFSVYLPSDGSVQARSIHPTPFNQAIRWNEESVLLVDDSHSIRITASSVLDSLNLHVVTAANGLDAMDRVAEYGQKLRAVITDVHMPGMDGIAFISELRKVMPNLGVIVMSGDLDETEATELRRLGVDSFVDKPFSEAKLSSELVKVIRC